ncbi:MAG: Rpn family recombination-promoting nuclease/putative transposase [Treponema sp.]|jgi:predicted transposase/invertase (TIGR01784 family)|nr:Rpn family recombination-promoting nuclease/putative transposase [Treponema sp.]
MKDELVSPLYDFAFAQIFGSKENLGTTRAFLKTVLDIPEDDYDQLTVEDPTLKRFFKQDKKGVVDLRLTTKSGRIIHIELQVKEEDHLRNRIMYYSARLISDQLKKGGEYGDLHQVVSILISNHILLDEEKSYANEYELRNKKGGSFTDLLKVFILELPKLPEQEDGALWPWLQFFKCKEQEEFEMLARKHPELKEAVSYVKKMSLSDQWRQIMLDRQNWKMSQWGQQKAIQRNLEEARTKALTEGLAEGLEKGMKKGMEKGIEKGMEEGMEKGAAEGRLEIARKMKAIGRPLPEIAEITGLPQEIVQGL